MSLGLLLLHPEPAIDFLPVREGGYLDVQVRCWVEQVSTRYSMVLARLGLEWIMFFSSSKHASIALVSQLTIQLVKRGPLLEQLHEAESDSWGLITLFFSRVAIHLA